MEKKQVFHVSMTVLKVVGTAGFIAAALVAPGVLRLVPIFIKGKQRKKYFYPSYLTNTISRLRGRGLIKLTKQEGKSYYAITEKGSEILA